MGSGRARAFALVGGWFWLSGRCGIDGVHADRLAVCRGLSNMSKLTKADDLTVSTRNPGREPAYSYAPMAWIAENRQRSVPTDGTPALTEELKAHLRDTYFPRYPTRRAVLLPALHAVQHEYGWIPPQALDELAAFLEISSGEVLDTASFYEEYWLKPKGQYLFQVCRSFACEMMSVCEPGRSCGTRELSNHLRQKLGIEVGQTSDDGRYTLVELECLGACGTAPVMLVNDVLYENVDTNTIDQILSSLPADPHDFKDPTVTWQEKAH